MGRGKGGIIQRGDSFIADFYYKGERFRAAIPGLSAAKKAHRNTAEAIFTQIQADIARDVFNLSRYFPDHPKAKRFRKGSDITVRETLDVWIERKRRECEASTWLSYKSGVDHYLIPEFGNLALCDLTTAHVRNWRDSLNISAQRINNVLISLRAIFNDAYHDGLIDSNPLDRIRHLPRHTPEPKPFTRQEMQDILSCCDGQVHNIFKFAFWTGLRTSELVALRWSDVNMNKGVAFIRHVRTRAGGDKDRPKTDAGVRNLELLPPALDALRAQQAFTQEGYVFLNPRTGEPWKHDGPLRKTASAHAIKAAEVPYRKMYNTRHTFASLMLSSGANPMWVARQMGHKDWGMIRKHYGRWLVDVDTAVQEKISFLWAPDRHKGIASG